MVTILYSSFSLCYMYIHAHADTQMLVFTCMQKIKMALCVCMHLAHLLMSLEGVIKVLEEEDIFCG